MEHEMQDASLHPDSSLLRTSSGDVAVVKLNPWRRHRPCGFTPATTLLTSQTTVSFAGVTLLKLNTWTATITLTVTLLGLKAVQTTKYHNKLTHTARDISDCDPVEDSSVYWRVPRYGVYKATSASLSLTLNDVLSRQVQHGLSARRISQTHP